MPAPSQWYPNHDAMCALCFGAFNKDELYAHPNGDVFDVCKNCAIAEAYGINLAWDNQPHRRDVIGARA